MAGGPGAGTAWAARSLFFLGWVAVLYWAVVAAAGRAKISIVEGDTTRPGGHPGTPRAHHFRPGPSNPQVATGQVPTSKACPPGWVLKVDFRAGENGDGRLYANSYIGGLFLVQPGDTFEYEVMWGERDSNCSTDFESGTEFRLRDHGPLDANGYSPHAERNFNMSKAAFGRWYHRSWNISHLAGKYIDKWVFSSRLPKRAHRTCYFRYIRVVDRSNVTRRIVFDDRFDPPLANAYMSGAVEATCQSQATVSADMRVHAPEGGSLRAGRREVFSGEIRAVTLQDLVATAAGGGASQLDAFGAALPQCAAAFDGKPSPDDDGDARLFANPAPPKELARLHPFDDFRRRELLHGSQAQMLVHGLRVVAKHAEKDLVLWEVYKREFPVPEPMPLPLWVPFDAPPLGPLSHLINSSRLELRLRYSVGPSQVQVAEESPFAIPLTLLPS